jgi:2-iminobutanoate/2-iminopropanoate deaminase
MPKKEIIGSPNVTAGQAPLSPATRFGNMVFVQGCTGRHPTSGELGKGIKEQTEFALERIKAILETAGTSLDNVLTNTCYVTRGEDLQGFNETYAEYFQTNRPARTTVLVNLATPEYLVEITSTACIPD